MATENDPFEKAELISRYLKGELSYEEHMQLREWADADIKNQQLLDELENSAFQSRELQFLPHWINRSPGKTLTVRSGILLSGTLRLLLNTGSSLLPY
jgi:hypothetical protein